MNEDLSGIKILVTRPIDQAQALCKKLLMLNAIPISFPTIVITDTSDIKTTQQALKKLSQQEIVIFISPTSVQKSLPLIFDLYQQWPSQVKVIALGAGTAQSLHNAGLTVDYFPKENFSSENLLASPILQQVNKKNIMLLRGNDGREVLADTLKARGANLIEVITYQRIKPSIDMPPVLQDWQEKKMDIIVCTSNSSLQNLFDLIGVNGREWLRNMSLLATSKRMLVLAKELGFLTTPWLAENPSDTAVVAGLLAWRRYYRQNK